MKLRSKIMVFGLLFMAIIVNTLSAQNSEKAIKNFIKIDSKFIGNQFEAGDYKVKDNPKLQVKRIESATLKKLNMEGAIVNVIWGAFLLEYWSKCKIFVPDTNDCEDCILLWYDYNQDNLVQPKKELRAICQRTLKACKIIVRERKSCE